MCISLDVCLHVCVLGFFSPFCRQNGKKKLPSFFGIEGGQERDTTTDKILQYIPGKASTNTSNPYPHCSQRLFPPKDSAVHQKEDGSGSRGSSRSASGRDKPCAPASPWRC